MTYFLIAGAGLAIWTTLNSQVIQLPISFMVASWDRLPPEWVEILNRYGAPYVIILGMLAVGAMPLIFVPRYRGHRQSRHYFCKFPSVRSILGRHANS